MRFVVFAVVLTALASCGGSKRVDRMRTVAPVSFASGPISSACLASDRKARSRSLCGCIQSVANRSLSSGDQRLAVSFYDDPQRAQDIRQSDRSSHEAFWKRYKAYATRAEQICRGL